MSRKFRLEQVLRVRHLQRDIAAAAAGAAAARTVAARTCSENILEEAAAQSFDNHGSPESFAAAVAARSASSARYQDALAALEEAEAEARAAQAVWAAAEGRAKGLQRLADRHEHARRAADLKADQAVIDEHAGRARGATTGVQGPAHPGLDSEATPADDYSMRGNAPSGGDA